ncbi:hypothetical protein HZS_707 [Henneguya salminicola]|nr:hypothetical protein HZS_707 [Henneguya salminicola]
MKLLTSKDVQKLIILLVNISMFDYESNHNILFPMFHEYIRHTEFDFSIFLQFIYKIQDWKFRSLISTTILEHAFRK